MKNIFVVAFGILIFQISTAQPTQARYLEALKLLVDQLVSTQITDPNDPDYGALISPSTNPHGNTPR